MRDTLLVLLVARLRLRTRVFWAFRLSVPYWHAVPRRGVGNAARPSILGWGGRAGLPAQWRIRFRTVEGVSEGLGSRIGSTAIGIRASEEKIRLPDGKSAGDACGPRKGNPNR